MHNTQVDKPVELKTMPYLKERDAAVTAALAAARVIRLHAGRIKEQSILEKGTHDLVTEIDEEAQSIIIGLLRESFPEYGFLAEEGAYSAANRTDEEGLRWIIDPIDGTTNFIHGAAPYAVSIALQHGSEVVVGVVLDVPHGELFSAVRGGGAYVNGAPIQVSRTDRLGMSLISTGFPYRTFGRVDAYLKVMRDFMEKAQGLRRPGSASLDIAHVAAGRFDGFFEEGLMPWDVAAGVLLVEEAGGRVSDFHNQSNPLHTEQFLASNGIIHDEMLSLLQPMRG